MLRKNVRVNIGKSKMVFKIFPQSTHNYLRNEKKSSRNDENSRSYKDSRNFVT